jgi:hypothetical protein
MNHVILFDCDGIDINILYISGRVLQFGDGLYPQIHYLFLDANEKAGGCYVRGSKTYISGIMVGYISH